MTDVSRQSENEVVEAVRDARATAIAVRDRRRAAASAHLGRADRQHAVDARCFRSQGHRRLRAGRTDHHRARPERRSPKSRRCWRQKDSAWASIRPTGVRCSARRPESGPIGGAISADCLRTGAGALWRGARSAARISRRERLRRSVQGRRQGGQERHRLRYSEARLRRVRHAVRADRSDACASFPSRRARKHSSVQRSARRGRASHCCAKSGRARWKRPGLAVRRTAAFIRLEGEKEPLAEKVAMLKSLCAERDVERGRRRRCSRQHWQR